MSSLSIQPTYPIFTDIDGQPLEAGYVWIGQANLDPQVNPINVYLDAALSIPATQPVRTLGGYPSRNGTPARLYVNSDYSIRVQNRNGSTVYSAPQALERYSGDLVSFTGFKSQIGVISDLAGNDGSDWIGFEAAGSGAVARSAQDKMRDVVSVKDFGAVGDGVTDDTAAMQAAHDTGQTIYYPQGTYQFTRITIPSGGIVGEGKLTILRTTDTTNDDVITYTGVDPTGLLINTVGGLFSNFTLIASSPTQKAAGAGISVVPAPYGGNPNENYLTIVDGIYVRNLPIGVSLKISSYFSVVNSYFAFSTIAGIYADMDSALFQDNGDNLISGNSFFTNASTSPSGRGIWYRGGGARIIGNKINGGAFGVDINPLRGTSIAIVEGNSVENQTVNALRGYIGSDFTPISVNDGYSFLQFVGNQIGGYQLTGPAISIDSVTSDPTFYNCSVSDNIIFNPVDYGARAIDIRQAKRFIVSNNLVDNSGVGYGSLFVASSASSGFVTRNHFLRANATYNSNVLNASTTTILDEIVSQATQSEAIGTLAAGAEYVAGIATKAELGDFAIASVDVNTGGCIISADVYTTDAVRVTISNPTGSPIVIGTANVRVNVFSK